MEEFRILTKSGSIIKRSKWGVGKLIGGYLYFHKDYIEELRDDGVVNAYTIKNAHDPTMFFNIVKYPMVGSKISLINSPDFDSSPEPYIADALTWDFKERTVLYHRYKNREPIYHHKWLFVADDYKHFDVQESKERSIAWTSLDDINYRRIGSRKYWETNVVPRIKQFTL